MTDMGAARGPGVLLVAATGLAAAAVAVDAGFDLPAPLRAVLFAAWLAAVGVLGWGVVGRPAGRRREAWAAGGAAVGTFALLVLCVPGAGRAGRLVPPWSAPLPARLRVTTGDPVVARGAGVTLACVAGRSVTLEVSDEAGNTGRPPVAEDLPGVWAARLPRVTGPLRYRFVVGPDVSAWHTVTPVDAVALTPATTFDTRPPAYAAGRYPPRRFAAGEAVECLAGGGLTATLNFDRPAGGVRAVWQPAGEEAARPATVELAADRQSATVRADIPAGGTLLVTVTGDHDHPTPVEVPVAAVPDHPPAFLAVGGFDVGRWAVRADEAVRLAVEAGDDVWAAPPGWSCCSARRRLRPRPCRCRWPAGAGGSPAG